MLDYINARGNTEWKYSGVVGELVRNPVPEVGHYSSCSLGQDGRSGNTEQITLKQTALKRNNGT